MIRTIPIVLLLGGCGLLDKTVEVSELLPPGESVRVPVVAPGLFEPDPPLDPLCPFTFDSPICVDANQDGGVDGFDVEVFFLLWNDGIRADFNRDGYIDTDYYQYDPPGSWCDWDAWFKEWQRGA